VFEAVRFIVSLPRCARTVNLLCSCHTETTLVLRRRGS
jgi:hypothetical protein